MKKSIFFILFLFLTGQSSILSREISGSDKFIDYRSLGEIRAWTFIVKDSTIGTLISTVKDEIEINNIDGYLIKEKLKLNYEKTGSSLKMNIESEHYVDSKGFYLGDKMQLKINDQDEKLELERSDEMLKGFTTRGGNEIDQSHTFKKNGYAVENNFIDQYELFLAMRDIKVGDIIEDSIFIPQSMTMGNIKAEVKDFINLRVYNQVFDSVFVIQYSEPQEQTHYFTLDKRLIKAVIPAQDLKIYLDVVTKLPEALTKSVASKRSILDMVIIYFIYLIAGIISLLFFIKDGYRWSLSYISLFIGGIIFIIIIFTQIPLQIKLMNNLFIPRVKLGGSPYFWGMLPALSAGAIQEILKALTIILIIKVSRIKGYKYIIIGAMCGVGFGIVEACYLVGGADSSQLFSISLLERGFMILFHTTSGALLGYAYSVSLNKLSIFAVLMIIVNSIFRYLPVFVQFQSAPPEMLSILLAFISMGLLFFTMLLFKKAKEI